MGLGERGASVDVVPVYRTVGSEDILHVPGDVDIALFTSSSTVEHFLKRASLPAGCKIGCIGPITAETLKKAGHKVDIEARVHTISGLVEAIEVHVADLK